MKFWTITKKELFSYFNSIMAYIVIGLFLVLTSFLFFRTFFLAGQNNMREFFGLIPYTFLFLLPAITMRSISEENKTGTQEILKTSSVTSFDIIFGKYLGAFLLGASYIAIGIFISCFTKNQIIAFLITVVVLFLLLLIGQPYITFMLPNWLIIPFKYLGSIDHYSNLIKGVIDIKNLVYYSSIICLFNYLAIRKIDN
jgi:ABC-2 type transport system permease protein